MSAKTTAVSTILLLRFTLLALLAALLCSAWRVTQREEEKPTASVHNALSAMLCPLLRAMGPSCLSPRRVARPRLHRSDASQQHTALHRCTRAQRRRDRASEVQLCSVCQRDGLEAAQRAAAAVREEAAHSRERRVDRRVDSATLSAALLLICRLACHGGLACADPVR